MMSIVISDLKKSFGAVTAVDIPELTINKGDLLGLVGNNGAGKTTLLRLLLDLTCPDSGTVSLNGFNPRQSEDWKSWTGSYLDEGYLIVYLTPDEYFEFIAKIDGISSSELKDRLTPMERFANGEIFHERKYIRSFSAGNKQKIGIIAALINQPQILILDEPFNFLDPSGQEYLKAILTDYHTRTGATIIVSSHNLQHVTDISTRILVMEKGVIVRDLPNDNKTDVETELNDYFAV